MLGDFARFDWPAFGDTGRLMQMMDRMLEEARGDFGLSDIRSAPLGAFPRVNVGETADSINVYAFAPGIAREDLDLSVEGNTLIIQGRRKQEAEGDGEGRTWYRTERFHGDFTRAVSLPDSVDQDQIEARLKDGVLTVRLRKREAVQPRRIEIKAA